MQRSLERRLKLHDWRIRQGKRSSSLILGRCPPLNLPVGSSLIAAVPLRHPRSRSEDRQRLRICFERVGLDDDEDLLNLTYRRAGYPPRKLRTVSWRTRVLVLRLAK